MSNKCCSRTFFVLRLILIATLLGGQYSVDSLKLAKDVAHFVCKATGLKPEVFSELLSQ